MKRKILTSSIVLIIASMLIWPRFNKIHADEVTEVTTFEEFKTAANNGGKIKLGSDITLTANTFVKDISEVDLNGYILNCGDYTLVAYSELTIKDTSSGQNGKVSSSSSFVIQIGSSSKTGKLTLNSGRIEGNVSYGVRVVNGELVINGGSIISNSYPIYADNGVKVTMNGGYVYADAAVGIQVKQNSEFVMNGGKIETMKYGPAVNLNGAGSSMTMNGGIIECLYDDGTGKKGGAGILAFKDSNVTINGGQIKSWGFALAGNGTNDGSANDGSNVKFTINGGSLTSTGATAVYAPQTNGETIITGGTITGEGGSGVEVRAGSLIVSGGTINGNKNEYQTFPNGNGSSTIGAAVSVVQHNTKQPIHVEITGGTFNANVPFSECNSMGNSQEDVEKISYNISGGVFNAEGDKTIDVADYQEKFISGGKYTHEVTNYVQDICGEKPEDNMNAVYKWKTITVNQSPYGYTTITRKKTVSDDGSTIVTEDDQTSSTMVRALYNDEVYITILPNSGYVPSGSNAVTTNGGAIIITDNFFESPDEDTEITIDFVMDENYEAEQSKDYSSDDEPNNIDRNRSGKNPKTGDYIIGYVSVFIISAIVLKLAVKLDKRGK